MAGSREEINFSMTTPGEDQMERVRRICLALPGASEKLSHGEPTFFVKKRVFAMFSNNHHNDGHVAVWIPAQPGAQESLVASFPAIYYRPPYVGGKGWVGIELNEIGNDELAAHIAEAWKMMNNSRRS
ncbi:MAG: MmcQ/YjbR family DNA-binding protein [Bryobacteraceae bacterium]|nr:MmcQ/YjbR family DNA-binding protein [Bryobacteraceae bacterium]